jgi:hypothetical protein
MKNQWHRWFSWTTWGTSSVYIAPEYYHEIVFLNNLGHIKCVHCTWILSWDCILEQSGAHQVCTLHLNIIMRLYSWTIWGTSSVYIAPEYYHEIVFLNNLGHIKCVQVHCPWILSWDCILEQSEEYHRSMWHQNIIRRLYSWSKWEALVSWH